MQRFSYCLVFVILVACIQQSPRKNTQNNNSSFSSISQTYSSDTGFIQSKDIVHGGYTMSGVILINGQLYQVWSNNDITEMKQAIIMGAITFVGGNALAKGVNIIHLEEGEFVDFSGIISPASEAGINIAKLRKVN